MQLTRIEDARGSLAAAGLDEREVDWHGLGNCTGRAIDPSHRKHREPDAPGAMTPRKRSQIAREMSSLPAPRPMRALRLPTAQADRDARLIIGADADFPPGVFFRTQFPEIVR